MTVGKKVLELDNIDKTFGAVNALSGIQLSVLAGEVVALVGDNGAGKSTLVKIAAGVIPPDQGNILFDGVSWPNGCNKSWYCCHLSRSCPL
jgi:D-xylose transport system ATP-binding protein